MQQHNEKKKLGEWKQKGNTEENKEVELDKYNSVQSPFEKATIQQGETKRVTI